MLYLFTREQFEELEKIIFRTQKEIDKIVREKGEIAQESAGDRWHSAEFMSAYVEEARLRKRLTRLNWLLNTGKIIEPKEQNKKVAIGNTVIIEYENGSQRKIILEGYLVSSKENQASIYSPLGKALNGAKRGQTKIVKIGKQKHKIKIIEILPPSH